MSITKAERLGYIQALRDQGIDLPDGATLTQIAAAVERLSGVKKSSKQSCLDYLCAQHRHLSGSAYIGEIVPSRTPPKFRPLRMSAQMQVNIARARAHQGPLITPDGVGNGNENSKVWTR